MHPVDEFAALKAEIRRLEARAGILRAAFLAGEAEGRSNQYEVLVRTQSRRVLIPDRLPEAILEDPRFWQTRRSSIVTLRELPPQRDLFGGAPDDPDDIVLIE